MAVEVFRHLSSSAKTTLSLLKEKQAVSREDKFSATAKRCFLFILSEVEGISTLDKGVLIFIYCQTYEFRRSTTGYF